MKDLKMEVVLPQEELTDMIVGRFIEELIENKDKKVILYNGNAYTCNCWGDNISIDKVDKNWLDKIAKKLK